MKSATTEPAMTEDAVEFRPDEFSRYIASEVGPYALIRPNDRADLSQEGLIAAWKAVESYDPSKGTTFKSWAIRCIDYALLQAFSRYKWTGMPPRSRAGGGSASKEQPLLIGDWNTDDADSENSELHGSMIKNVTIEDHSARADWIYHQVEIWKAVSKLKPDQQKYVYLRFWLGFKPSEMAPFFPHVKNYEVALWHRRNAAKDQLKEALSHLIPDSSV